MFDNYLKKEIWKEILIQFEKKYIKIVVKGVLLNCVRENWCFAKVSLIF